MGLKTIVTLRQPTEPEDTPQLVARATTVLTGDTDLRRLLSTSSQSRQEQPETRTSIHQVGLTTKTQMLVNTHASHTQSGG